jgi:hypothetical protein
MRNEKHDFYTAFIDLSTVQFTPKLLRCIPAETALKYQVLPVFERPDCLAIVLAKIDLNVIDNLTHALNRSLEVRLADKEQIDIFVRRFYGGGNSVPPNSRGRF